MVEPTTASEALLLANLYKRAQNLYALGYRAKWKDKDNGILVVTAPHGGVYELNTKQNTCACLFFTKTKGRYDCKHLLGWEGLMREQEAAERAEQAGWLRFQFYEFVDEASGETFIFDATLGNALASEIAERTRFFPKDFGIDRTYIAAHYRELDNSRAETADITQPLLFVPHLAGTAILIDGWHRLARAVETGVSSLPAYLLSAPERDAILVMRFPKGEKRNTAFLFPLGELVLTPGAEQAFLEARTPPSFLLWRHITGDWGEVPQEDKRANDAAVGGNGRLFSAYRLSTGCKLWIITEWDRSVTTLLLPSDY